MFLFLVLRGGAHSKVDSPSSGSNQDDLGPGLKVHGERLSQHCWEVLSMKPALTSVGNESSCVRSWRSSSLAFP